MKRIIPAIIILIFTISLCICSHVFIDMACNSTTEDIEAFLNDDISANTLESSWQKRKEKMSFFVNHSFLDELSVYIGELTIYNKSNSYIDHIEKNIQTVLFMIKEEQRLSAHSFY